MHFRTDMKGSFPKLRLVSQLSDQFIRKIQIWVDNPAEQMLVGLRFLGKHDTVLL